MSEVAAISDDGHLQPAKVELILRTVLRNGASLCSKLAAASWSAERLEQGGLFQTITFNPRPADSARAPDVLGTPTPPASFEHLLDTIGETSRKWLQSLAEQQNFTVGKLTVAGREIKSGRFILFLALWRFNRLKDLKIVGGLT